MAKVIRHGSAIEFGPESWHRGQSLQLGAECEDRAHPAVIERLLTKTVTDQMKFSVPPVPERQSKHPFTGVERPIDPPAIEGRDQDLRVRSTSKDRSATFESSPDLKMVVDLSVVGHHPPATGRDHGLCAARTEIDYRKTPVTERHPCVSIDPDATVVGPAMLHGRCHGRCQGSKPVGTRRGAWVEDAGYPAHARSAQPSTLRGSSSPDRLPRGQGRRGPTGPLPPPRGIGSIGNPVIHAQQRTAPQTGREPESSSPSASSPTVRP